MCELAPEYTYFHSVFLRDNLPVEPKRMQCGVLNLDDTSENGTHWVAWYRDNGKNIISTATAFSLLMN